jgi:hypothetical protein
MLCGARGLENFGLHLAEVLSFGNFYWKLYVYMRYSMQQSAVIVSIN